MTKAFLEGLGLTPEQIAAIETEQTKVESYRWLLTDLGVNYKYIDLILRARAEQISALELTEDGQRFKDVGRLAEQIKEDWSAFMFDNPKTLTPEPKPPTIQEQFKTRAQEIAQRRQEHFY